jgi:hypothetical protein
LLESALNLEKESIWVVAGITGSGVGTTGNRKFSVCAMTSTTGSSVGTTGSKSY